MKATIAYHDKNGTELSEEEVRNRLRMMCEASSQREVSRLYNYDPSYISRAIRGFRRVPKSLLPYIDVVVTTQP